ncbi:MAG TPA: N4-gp56 family major capsid protein [Baekduia sp.]|nr:N4-gp56 family major capsid protein [Baekduia sp.]
MTTTNFTRLTTEQKTVWSRDLWKVARNMSFVNKFLGEGPNSMIQHIKELTKTEKGARAVMTLVPDLEGDGVAGDRRLKGNEEQIKAYDKVIRIDQLRNANISEGRVSDQKSIVRFRETSRDVLGYWLSDRIDQMAFLFLSGVALSNKNNGATRTGSDLINLEFAADVAAPTSARKLRWSASSGLVVNGATSGVTAADTPSYEMVVKLKAYAKEEYIRGIRVGGQEKFHLFLTPTAYAALKMDENYIKALRHARERGNGNPLFTGGPVDLDGVYIHEFRHVYNTSGLSSGSKWGSGGTVEGCQALFCGAQALGMADLGLPGWVEEGDDYENQRAVSIWKIFGFLKPKYTTQYGQSPATEQDFGVVSVYMAQ